MNWLGLIVYYIPSCPRRRGPMYSLDKMGPRLRGDDGASTVWRYVFSAFLYFARRAPESSAMALRVVCAALRPSRKSSSL